MRAGATDLVTEQARDDCGRQRSKNDGEMYSVHDRPLNLSSSPVPGR